MVWGIRNYLPVSITERKQTNTKRILKWDQTKKEIFSKAFPNSVQSDLVIFNNNERFFPALNKKKHLMKFVYVSNLKVYPTKFVKLFRN